MHTMPHRIHVINEHATSFREEGDHTFSLTL